ncbi:MAG TPA: hypothetical protein VNG51_00260 [Ktedonobacteraceae bacterium]|nr:hypothetical protein [Ktedonobacteraceae bacterium]
MEQEQQQTDLIKPKVQIEAAKTPTLKLEAFEVPIKPTAVQVEKLRLILSTYQDGTGMLFKKGRSLPGWRDFERAIAVAFDGQAQESKHVFDVIVPSQHGESSYGISCKMRGELSKSLDRTDKKGHFRKGRVSMEMSNAAKYFWDTIKKQGIDETTFKDNPMKAGVALVNLVKVWHSAASIEGIDLSKSFYLVLEWDGKGNTYRLFQYSLELPDPDTLKWHFPIVKSKDGKEKIALHLSGNDEFGTIFEWYSSSGGQLKYYPLTEDALWHSDEFQLEPLPESDDLEYGIVSKVRTYFPLKWGNISK